MSSLIVSLWRGIMNSSKSIRATCEYLWIRVWIWKLISIFCVTHIVWERSSVTHSRHPPVHASIQAVVERSEESFGADFLLRFHIQIPWQHVNCNSRWQSRALTRCCILIVAWHHRCRRLDRCKLRNLTFDVVLEDTFSFRANRMIVEGEMWYAEQMIQFQKF